ncbi:MAG: glycosyltransferase family 9 protein [Bacteroidota bacterium]
MKKILVIQTASIGDVILVTPILENLHRVFPAAEIDILVKKGQESLFLNHPFLHQTLIWNKRSFKYLRIIGLLLKIRLNRYDLVVNVQRFASSGFLTAFSGAPKRIGFSKNPFASFFTTQVEHVIGGGAHEVERNMMLLYDLIEYNEVKPRLYPSEKDIEKIKRYIRPPYYTISPTSLWHTKQLPAGKWISFLQIIDPETRIYFLGSGGDGGICDNIISKSGINNGVNLAGKLSLLESAALMKEAKMNFTNDSAPMHLASAVNAPVTAIFCSTTPKFGFGPLSDDSHILETIEKLACRPCGLHGLAQCPEKHFACAMTINTQQFLERL